jgi:5-methylcytosine-specific restriction protein B
MAEITGDVRSDVTWFVGASGTVDGQAQDYTDRFLSEGIWENGYRTKFLDLVRSMRPGERIAIKSSYTRKNGLPFDNRGRVVSVLAIKAVGTITENLRDGRRVKVAWQKIEPPREWFFYTYRQTVWRVVPDDWMPEGLIKFAFDGQPQDIDRFRNAPAWRERFGSIGPEKRRFAWTTFYEAIADQLARFSQDRAPLVRAIQEISSRVDGLGHLADDRYEDGGSGFVRDICPFTTLGTFNRNITETNRKAIASELANFLGVEEAVPESFEGIPLLNNMRSWYFPFEADRSPDHIDALWKVFTSAIELSALDDVDETARMNFASSFDSANGRPSVAWNLTMGLYWMRPWSFISLDRNSRRYLDAKLRVSFGRNGSKRRCSADDYLTLMDTLKLRFEEATYPVHSFPELSLEAWSFKEPPALQYEHADQAAQQDEDDDESATFDVSSAATPPVTYSIDDIVKDGSFLDRSDLITLLERLRTKRNLILQGPPGTGKTWLAKRLAFACIGGREEGKIRVVQFHPNLSYEDFVRGWRPTGDGKLALVDGVFMQLIQAASKDSASKYVMVIEEINRGNPAQIFGELLTLLEAGKRSPRDALELCYPDPDGKHRPVHVPENLYVIGTMNIADRSLALVDLAFRRRFAFVTLEPKLGPAWRDWVTSQCGVAPDLVESIERRLMDLNERIAEKFGAHFKLGHSYVTPAHQLEQGATRDWFIQVVRTEITPQLEEYWVGATKEAADAAARMLLDW